MPTSSFFRYFSFIKVMSLPVRYFLISIATHAIFILIASLGNTHPIPLIVNDSKTYIINAQNLWKLGVFSRENSVPYLWEPYRTPGYPLLIAISEIVTHSEYLILFCTCFLAGLASWVSVKLTAYLGANKLGQHISGCFMAVLPNSLGLASFLLTDAIFGYLFLIWLYYLYLGFVVQDQSKLSASALILILLQFLKPTANLGIIFIVCIAVLFARTQKLWVQTILLAALAVITPLSFSVANFHDNGIFSPSLLGIQTAREYLEVRYLSEESGQGIPQLTEEIRKDDAIAAQLLSEPMSYYGRLYKIQQAQVSLFIRQHPTDVIRLMVLEALKQFIAPQEFAVLVFVDSIPSWMRMIGSFFTLTLWIGSVLGIWILIKENKIQPVLLFLGVLLFFLVTGSISHFVGARLRFPFDLLAISFFSYGISSLNIFHQGERAI